MGLSLTAITLGHSTPSLGHGYASRASYHFLLALFVALAFFLSIRPVAAMLTEVLRTIKTAVDDMLSACVRYFGFAFVMFVIIQVYDLYIRGFDEGFAVPAGTFNSPTARAKGKHHSPKHQKGDSARFVQKKKEDQCKREE